MKLSTYLARKGESTRQFGLRAGLHQPHIVRLVRGQYHPDYLSARVVGAVKRATAGAVNLARASDRDPHIPPVRRPRKEISQEASAVVSPEQPAE